MCLRVGIGLLVLCVLGGAAFATKPDMRECKIAEAGLLKSSPGVYGSFRWKTESGTIPFKVVRRLQYFGKRRDEFIQNCNRTYGEGNWTVGYYYNGKMVPVEEALQIYEDAYYHFLKSHPDLLDTICRECKDVYDYDPKNVEAGTDYGHQEGPRTHLQDISVRRVLARLGRKFEGTKLWQIRDEDSELFVLHPGRVPLATPGIVLEPRVFQPDWILPGTAEDFWQNNKFLIVKKNKGKEPVGNALKRILNRLIGRAGVSESLDP